MWNGSKHILGLWRLFFWRIMARGAIRSLGEALPFRWEAVGWICECANECARSWIRSCCSWTFPVSAPCYLQPSVRLSVCHPPLESAAQALSTAGLREWEQGGYFIFRLFHLLCLSSYTKPQPLVEEVTLIFISLLNCHEHPVWLFLSQRVRKRFECLPNRKWVLLMDEASALKQFWENTNF